MEARPGTWKEIGPGVVIQDPNLKHWLVIDEAPRAGEPPRPDGKRYLRLQGAWKKQVTIERRPDDAACTIMEASEPEAIMLLGEMGGHVIRHENEKTLPIRAMKFRMDPVSAKGARAKDRIRDHIDMHHGVYVNDNWAAKTAKQLYEEHEEMHSPEFLTMTTPHHHAKEG